jgi:hypothetical protein
MRAHAAPLQIRQTLDRSDSGTQLSHMESRISAVFTVVYWYWVVTIQKVVS